MSFCRLEPVLNYPEEVDVATLVSGVDVKDV